MIVLDMLIYYTCLIGCWIDAKWQKAINLVNANEGSNKTRVVVRVENSLSDKEQTRIQEERRAFIKKKHIHHVAFYVDEEYVSDMSDHHTIEAVIAWCREWNVEHITFYDIKGYMKEIYEPYNNKHVHFHSFETYGPPVVASLYNDHYTDPFKKSQSAEEFGEMYTTLYREHYTLPEPDLLVVVSPLFSVHGFSPIHLRYTELRQVADWTLLTKHALCNLMYDFCQIIHRKGK